MCGRPWHPATMTENNAASKTLWGAIKGAGVNHWLTVAVLTLTGLLLAEYPLFPHLRDRVYMWMQNRFHRSQRRVVVVAIDDDDYWRGPFKEEAGLSRRQLATLLDRIGTAHPALVAVDVGLETAAPPSVIEQDGALRPTLVLLNTVASIGRDCSVVLTKTIVNAKPPYRRAHDVYDAFGFGPDSSVTYGHVSAAQDIRQIPISAPLDDGVSLDSFALAIYRASSHDDLPTEYEDPHHVWPYSFFLPAEAFTPRDLRRNGTALLTARAVLAAPPQELRKWFNSQVILVGGVWHKTPHPGSDFTDGRDTPLERLPGVLTHANYVQSLLWEAMFPMSEALRTVIEVLLALGISLIFLRARGWRRFGFIIGIVALVITITWIFSAALGLFFDLVLPVAFLGIHAIVEELSEKFNITLRVPLRHSHTTLVSVLVATVIGLSTTLVVRARNATDHRLDTEGRLQVVHVEPPPYSLPTVDAAVTPAPIIQARTPTTMPAIDRRNPQQLASPPIIFASGSTYTTSSLVSLLADSMVLPHLLRTHPGGDMDNDTSLPMFRPQQTTSVASDWSALHPRELRSGGSPKQHSLWTDAKPVAAAWTRRNFAVMETGSFEAANDLVAQEEASALHSNSQFVWHPGTATNVVTMNAGSESFTDVIVGSRTYETYYEQELLSPARQPVMLKAKPYKTHLALVGEHVALAAGASVGTPPDYFALLGSFIGPDRPAHIAVLKPGDPLTEILVAFSDDARTLLKPRAASNTLAVTLPSHGFNLPPALLPAETVAALRPLIDAAIDDATLRVEISLSPTAINQSVAREIGVPRMQAVSVLFTQNAIAMSRIRVSAYVPESDATIQSVGVEVTICR